MLNDVIHSPIRDLYLDAVIQNADSVAVAVSVAVSRERDDTVVAERIAVVAA